jgi:hypothetical protein
LIDVRIGDCRELIHTLDDKSIDLVVTSPPYWGLRNYGTEPIIFDGLPDCEHEWADDITIKRGHPGNKTTLVGTQTASLSKSANNFGSFCSKCNAWKGCVDEQTEILTTNGWRAYSEIKAGDLVATYNVYDNKIEYQPIQEIFIDNYKGDMVHILNRHVDQLLTPNHRVLHKNKCHSGVREWTTDWIFTEAHDVSYKNGLILPVAALYNGENSIGEDLAELIGWILTDGTLSTGGGNRITVYQSKEYGINRIYKLLDNLHISYSVHIRSGNSNYTQNAMDRQYIRFSGEPAINIRKILNNEKKLNSFLLHLNQKELKCLFNGIYGGDGWFQSLF